MRRNILPSRRGDSLHASNVGEDLVNNVEAMVMQQNKIIRQLSERQAHLEDLRPEKEE